MSNLTLVGGVAFFALIFLICLQYTDNGYYHTYHKLKNPAIVLTAGFGRMGIFAHTPTQMSQHYHAASLTLSLLIYRLNALFSRIMVLILVLRRSFLCYAVKFIMILLLFHFFKLRFIHIITSEISISSKIAAHSKYFSNKCDILPSANVLLLKGLSKQEEQHLNQTEFHRLAARYLDTVYRVALNGCKNHADAEDVVQNTFLKLLNKEDNFIDEEHAKKWLIRVAVNECNSMWRSPWKKRTSSLDELTTEPAFSSPEKSALYYAVLELPTKYRQVIHLYYFEGYHGKEIADILGISETAVQTRLLRARQKLKEILKEA